MQNNKLGEFNPFGRFHNKKSEDAKTPREKKRVFLPLKKRKC